MASRIFIDGEAGTTGLQIRERLAGRSDLTLLSVDPARRKDTAARAEKLNEADVVILCLPDPAAVEAVSLIARKDVKVIDASSAHRVDPIWTYGFPEMDKEQRSAIEASTRISNPGCFATGAIALLRPLVKAGLVPPTYPLSVSGLSGYSGGGRTLIEEFEKPVAKGTSDIARIYSLPMAHKHLPEITKHASIARAPVFMPTAARFAQGMLIEVPLALWAIESKPKAKDLHDAFRRFYEGERFIEVVSAEATADLQKTRSSPAAYVEALDPEGLNGTNRLRIAVFGSESGEEARVVAVFDNLGKGASGAAVQNLNILLGVDEALGLQ